MGKRVDDVALDRRESFPAGFPAVSRKLIAFGWYGGKYSHLDWLLPHIPADVEQFCDVFGGSGAVALNMRDGVACTYNDLDGDLVNFFRALRDETEELIRRIVLTPFSREEFAISLLPAEGLSDVERARRFFVRARQCRTGMAQAATLGRWANHKETIRRGMPGGVSKWNSAADKLWEVAGRLKSIQIENRPALSFIRQYDKPGVFLYVDPPYVHSTRGDSNVYAYEMSDAEHRDLAVALRSFSGRVAVSGYRCDLMDELYAGWVRKDAPKKSCSSSLGDRQESLWMNYTQKRAVGPKAKPKPARERKPVAARGLPRAA